MIHQVIIDHAPDLDSVIARIDEHAFTIDDATICPHCRGEVPLSDQHGRRIVHSILGGFGADWDADDVAVLVRASHADPAGEVKWLDGFGDHDLYVKTPFDKGPFDRVPRQREYLFQIPRPDKATP